MRQIPKEHQIYRHFKGTLYQIVTIAKHSETKEDMVVYRAIYNDNGNWVRPLSMFLSEVDHDKYPLVKQKYRFTLMDRGRAVEEDDPDGDITLKQTDINEPLKSQDDKLAETIKEEIKEGTCPDPVETEESLELDPLLEQFLDADSYQEKLDIFYLMKKRGTPDMLSYVAMSLDIEISQSDDFDEQYRQILNCLKTMEKYECNRLRP